MQVRKNQKGLGVTKNCNGDKNTPNVSSAEINLETAKKDFLDIAALIRSIQRSEGTTDCFRKGITDCDQVDCKWSYVCLEGHHVLKKE